MRSDRNRCRGVSTLSTADALTFTLQSFKQSQQGFSRVTWSDVHSIRLHLAAVLLLKAGRQQHGCIRSPVRRPVVQSRLEVVVACASH